MKIIIGHSNLDLDCIGSMVLARYLYPDHRLIRSIHIHPVARNLYNLYQYHLDFLQMQDIASKPIEQAVIVDTRSYNRVKEFLSPVAGPIDKIEIYDHHESDSSDIPNAVIHNKTCGANTTILVLELLKRNTAIDANDATIALTGIYADTGNFTHENVQDSDFQAASYLLEQNASLNIVKTFLNTMTEQHQISLFHDMLNHLIYKNYHGHPIILSYIELEKQVGGLAAVVEKIFDVENPDALFAVFSFRKNHDVLIIARSQENSIELHRILETFGGGGHAQASSALIKKQIGKNVYHTLDIYLQTALLPASNATQIMTRNVFMLQEDVSLLKASLSLERINHTGTPITNSNGKLAGFLTLRDIMKGRKSNQMHAPVKAYMTKNVITGNEHTTIREIEQLIFRNNIGHLPIVRENQVVGIVTRSDYLTYMEKRREERKTLLNNIQNPRINPK